jgi:hypothetical protein
MQLYLVGGFNHLEKYESQLGRMTSHIWNGKIKKCLKPPTRTLRFFDIFCNYSSSFL